MANMNCQSCDDLRQNAPNVIVNGLDTTACNSLKNDTGMSPGTSTNDCADLEDLNDCLVGNMEQEIDSYDVCEWQDFMKALIPNVWTVSKGIICAICGLWTNIHNIIARLVKVECFVSTIGKTQNFAIDETYIKLFNNVQFNKDPSNPDLSIPMITGNAYCGYMTGSLILPSNFESTYPSSSLTTHGALLYEYRVKLSDFNLKRFWPAQMQENANGSGIHAHVFRFTSNSSTKPYAAGDTGYASYSVPEGWEYLQVRITSYDDIPTSGKITLAGVIPVLMNPESIKC